MDLLDINNSCSAWFEITNIVIWKRKCRETKEKIQKNCYQLYIQSNLGKESLVFYSSIFIANAIWIAGQDSYTLCHLFTYQLLCPNRKNTELGL